jgi:DNA-binding response OmpR family regulator
MDQDEAVEFLLDCLEEFMELTPLAPHEIDGMGMDLRPSERLILMSLYDASPKVITRETLDRACDLKRVVNNRKESNGHKVVDVHMSHIRRKLREANAPCKIQTVWGVGYKLVKIRD